uniref:Uncharacterized protein n=1 Tax=Caudovirales sp. ct2KA10 TaxID=2825757 RepID=A0A8S5U4S4_9CAUD|nr:MAG TPA: hypothetical protein [Caudovirales sp. ct2KA10]
MLVITATSSLLKTIPTISLINLDYTVRKIHSGSMVVLLVTSTWNSLCLKNRRMS